MSFHKWSGLESEFSHENEQITRLTKILKERSVNNNEEIHLLTNFYVNGEELDALVILPKANLLIIDLKTGSGKITGQENGDWYCSPENGDKFKINQGRKNPLAQARDKRWALINYIDARKTEIFSHQKSHQMDFVHTKSIIGFSEDIIWDKKQIPEKNLGWFDVICIDHISEILDRNRSKILDLNSDEIWKIPTLLSLLNEEDKPKVTGDKESKGEILEIEINEDSGEKINYNDGYNEMVQGYFSGIEKNKIKIKFSDGQEKYVVLNDIFEGTIEQLQKLSDKRRLVIEKDEIEINLIKVIYSNGSFSFTENSLIVLEPEWLINVTALTQFDFCERSLFNRRYSIQHQNEHMLKGSIIHEVFETMFEKNNDDEHKRKLNESINKRGLEFALSNIDPSIMIQNVEPHIEALSSELEKNIPIDGNLSKVSERFIINPYLGLKGKIDAVINNDKKMRAIELKTGKSWGGKVKDGHAFQAQAYSLLMEHKYEQKILDPSVIYSGDHPFTNNLSKRAEFSYEEKAHVVHLRNKLVLADYLFDLEYATNPNKCRNCSEKTICSSLYQIEVEHDPNNLPVYIDEIPEYPNEKWSKVEKKYFNQYNKWLTEEYRIIKEKEGEYYCKTVESRISDLKCVVINNYIKKDTNEYVLYCNNQSEIRDSDPILISDVKGPVKGECVEAYVKTVSKNSITIRTHVEIDKDSFEPRYIDKYDSETLFERNFAAVYQLFENEKLVRLKEIILGEKPANSNKLKEIAEFSDDVEYQNQQNAVKAACGIEDFLLIKGPPGTGKTVTVSKIINQLVLEGKKVFISCYTHRAVNEVIKKLEEYFPDIEIYKIGSRLDEDGIKLLEKEIRSEQQIDSQIEKATKIINSSPVYIGTTHAWLTGRFDNLIHKNEDNVFDVAIIDEASQVILPSILGVVRLASKFILVGDEKQLPPVVQSELAKGLEQTLFEKLYSDYSDKKDIDNLIILLNKQYRMAEPIANFISNEFYEGLLQTADECKKIRLNIDLDKSALKNIVNPNEPMTLVNTAVSPISPRDRTSPIEVEIITDILSDLINCGLAPERIGIIAPYRAQVAELRRSIEGKMSAEVFKSSIQGARIVDTVDRFQGDEREVIIFSLCLLNKEIPNLLRDDRRINVAISRSKSKFIGVGDWNLVSKSKLLSNLVDYVKNNDNCSFIDYDKI